MTATNPNPNPLTIREALRQLDAKELSTVELMKDVLTRIQATDHEIMAWLDVRPRYLLDLAEAADRRRTLPKPALPHFGIPIGVKDIIDVASYQTVCNMKAREQIDPAPMDADVVAKLRQSGVLFLGKTETQEAAAGIFSDPCKNPWDPERIPGGSSGGSAAAIANGTCLGALGTDTGGSIRIPAALCGVTGLKPTLGRLSNRGIHPLSPSLDTPGPMANTVSDCMALYLAMQGKYREIPAMWERFPEDGVNLKGKRIGVFTNFFTEQIQREVDDAVKDVAGKAEQLGAEIVHIEWPEAYAARVAAVHISRIECAQVHRDLLHSAPELMGEQLRIRVELGAILPADIWFNALAAQERARQSIAALFEQHQLDATIAPSTPVTAPKVGEIVITYEDGSTEETGGALTRFTSPFNATGQPVFALPAGVDDKGLPIGISLVGRPDDEWHLADIAHALEQVL